LKLLLARLHRRPFADQLALLNIAFDLSRLQSGFSVQPGQRSITQLTVLSDLAQYLSYFHHFLNRID
jgi:hypothetical protein